MGTRKKCLGIEIVGNVGELVAICLAFAPPAA
jgi:hypothetical protein